jgi:hypothetical protein
VEVSEGEGDKVSVRVGVKVSETMSVGVMVSVSVSVSVIVSVGVSVSGGRTEAQAFILRLKIPHKSINTKYLLLCVFGFIIAVVSMYLHPCVFRHY